MTSGLFSSASARPHLPSMKELTTPNPQLGGPPSLDSGLRAVPPCRGAAQLLPIWSEAARVFGLRWQILAAITKVESGMGCNMGPSSAGAIGWTQFLPSTWKRWGMDADGDGKADPYNAVDAIFSTARYLRVTGAPQDYYRALYAYNHADWYVRLVLETASQFGQVDESEFSTLADITDRAVRLRRELSELQEELEEGRRRLRELRGELEQARTGHRRASKLLKTRIREYEAAVQRLDRATFHYINLTQQVNAAGQNTSTPEQQVLNYLSEAAPQDTLLVYQSARALLDEQSNLLVLLRESAMQADRLRLEVQDLTERRRALLELRSRRAAEQRRLLRQTKRQLREGQRKLRAYQRLARSYARRFSGALEASPFGGQMVDATLPGRLIWPLSGQLTSPFGPRWGRLHAGVDIAASTGTPIRASADGLVTFSGQQSGYGNFVCVTHGRGVQTCYAHMSKIRARRGQLVAQGDVLGYVGCTGRCFGPHLHFEVRINGQPQDPMRYLPH